MMAKDDTAVSDDEISLSGVDDGATLTGGKAVPGAGRGTLRRVAVGVVVIAVCVGAVFAVMMATSRRAVTVTVPEKFSAQFSSQGTFHPEYTYTGRIHKSTGADGNWEVQAVVEGTDPETRRRTVVTLVNNRAYYEEYPTPEATTPDRTGCFDPKRVPPLNDLDEVFDGAVAVPEGEVLASPVSGACAGADGDKYALTWGSATGSLNDNTFYYCQTDSDAHQIIGLEFVATVWDLDASPEGDLGLTVPNDLTTNQPLVCEELPPLSALSQSQQASATSRRLGQPAALAPKAARRKLTDTECYFIHGSGPSSDASPTTSYSAYWGSVENYVGSQCDSVSFMKRDYLTAGWDDPNVASDLCDELISGHGSTVNNRIIFTHGYASLALANAFYTGECSKGSSTDWYSIGAPWSGSPAADIASTLCTSYASLTGGLNTDMGFCDGGSTSTAMSTLATSYSSPSASFSTLAATARTLTDGAMCAWNMYGTNSGNGAQLQTVGDLATWSQFHDGFTPVDDCKNIGTNDDEFQLSNAAAPSYYAPVVNHLDLTCRYGNAFLDLFKVASPCSWYNSVTA